MGIENGTHHITDESKDLGGNIGKQKKGEGLSHSILRKEVNQLENAKKQEVEYFFRQIKKETQKNLLNLAKEIEDDALKNRKSIGKYKTIYENEVINISSETIQKLADLRAEIEEQNISINNKTKEENTVPTKEVTEQKNSNSGDEKVQKGKNTQTAPKQAEKKGKTAENAKPAETKEKTPKLTEKEIYNQNYKNIMSVIETNNYDFNGWAGYEHSSRKSFADNFARQISAYKRVVDTNFIQSVMNEIAKEKNIDYGHTQLHGFRKHLLNNTQAILRKKL